MESIGEKLKSTRIEKDYSIEQVARDTNIARQYLTALEEENFDAFPGETYLVGFLKNYAEYLGLSGSDMITLYRNMILQEQPVPMEELIVRKNGKGLKIALVILIVAVLGAGGYLLYPRIVKMFEARAERVQTPVAQEPAGTVFDMTGVILEDRFAQGDSVRIFINERTYVLEIGEVGNALTFLFNGDRFELKLGNALRLDLNEDGEDDVHLYLSDVDRSAAVPQVVLRIDRDVSDKAVEADSADEVSAAENMGSTSEQSRIKTPEIVITADEKETFTLTVLFSDFCLMQYSLDGGERVEKIFQSSDQFRINVRDRIHIGLSNAGIATGYIGVDSFAFGDLGEVVSKLLKWERNEETNQYELQLLTLY